MQTIFPSPAMRAEALAEFTVIIRKQCFSQLASDEGRSRVKEACMLSYYSVREATDSEPGADPSRGNTS